MLQVLEQGDLSDGSAGCPLLVLKPNLLQSNQVVSQTTLTLEHRSVSPLKSGTNRCMEYFFGDLTTLPKSASATRVLVVADETAISNLGI